MFGVGSGGTIAILAAAADPRIQTIDVVDPWGDWPDWMAKSSLIPEAERPNYLKREFLKKVAPLDPVQWLPQLPSRHVRLQQVLDDSVTPRGGAGTHASGRAGDRPECSLRHYAAVFRRCVWRQAVAMGKDQLRPASPRRPAAQIRGIPRQASKPSNRTRWIRAAMTRDTMKVLRRLNRSLWGASC